MYRATFAQVHLDNLRFNLNQVRAQLSPEKKILAVVKADAYGHGAVETARCLLSAGAYGLCVAIAEEGEALRSAGIDAPIFVLGGVNAQGAEASVRLGLIQACFSVQTLLDLQASAQRLGKTAWVDLKLDTGMGRIGLRTPDEVETLLAHLKRCPNVRLHGAFTHFSRADESDEAALAYTHGQYERFMALSALIRAQYPTAFLHAANSAGIFEHDYAHLDGVRPGIVLYGYSPDPAMALDLRPVMDWQTQIVHLKTIQSGDAVSYGGKFIAHKPTRVATLPVGYADGYHRVIGGRGWVLVGGRRAPVIGRVCMDQMMVDVTGIDCAVGDPVMLLGRQGGQTISADDLAAWCDTISYEIVLGVSQRVPRLYVP